MHINDRKVHITWYNFKFIAIFDQYINQGTKIEAQKDPFLWEGEKVTKFFGLKFN